MPILPDGTLDKLSPNVNTMLNLSMQLTFLLNDSNHNEHVIFHKDNKFFMSEKQIKTKLVTYHELGLFNYFVDGS